MKRPSSLREWVCPALVADHYAYAGIHTNTWPPGPNLISRLAYTAGSPNRHTSGAASCNADHHDHFSWHCSTLILLTLHTLESSLMPR